MCLTHGIFQMLSVRHICFVCYLLTGAISYNSSKIDITHANYQTGYLTYKVGHS